ncbi:MAG: autotransporter outer membrane beta-barrel domain-containing protein [Prevotella sp.]|nr:autotransporter outer membrane beta-barrel domain-containing protein [Prevotella sp.]
MRKILIVLTVFLTLPAWGQDIEIKDFARNHTSLVARMNPVYDNADEACALIRFSVRDTMFIIEPNMGVVKRVNKPGEIQLYVPAGTKRMTVRYKNFLPLRDYVIPEALEGKATYDAIITVKEDALTKQKANREHNVFVGAGYQVIAISGPSLALGFKMKQHVVELGAVIGLSKTDDLYFYKGSNTLKAAWKYSAIRAQARYGYEIPLTDFLSIIPQAGVAMNMFSGSSVADADTNTDDFKNASSVAGLIAARLTFSISDQFKVQLTPEYDFGISKSDNCKLISEYDNTFKSWTDGFNLNVGIILFF